MKRFVLYTLLIFLVFSCSPEDGEDGATGSQGLQGERGLAGDDAEPGQDGEDGPQGEPGTANVIYSDWIPSGLGEENITETAAFFNIPTNELTLEIKTTGLIMVYGRSTTSFSVIHPLPKSLFGTRMQHYEFAINELNQNITIWIHSIDGTGVGIPFYDDYRYVIVPGGIAASKSNINFAKMTYEEVVTYFGIED